MSVFTKVAGYVLARLKEQSTYQGLNAILTTFGVVLAPDVAQGIVTAGVGIAGLLAVVFPGLGASASPVATTDVTKDQ